MADSKTVKEKLQEAIAEEVATHRNLKQLYDKLTSRMWAYQMGRGTAPSSHEFEQWSQAVEELIQLKKIGIEPDSKY